LTKKEISELSVEEGQKGLTIVPLSVYNKGRKLKVEIAVVRGKKKYDKRQAIKKRDSDREIQRSL
jgi:SsrA-binding protein